MKLQLSNDNLRVVWYYIPMWLNRTDGPESIISFNIRCASFLSTPLKYVDKPALPLTGIDRVFKLRKS